PGRGAAQGAAAALRGLEGDAPGGLQGAGGQRAGGDGGAGAGGGGVARPRERVGHGGRERERDRGQLAGPDRRGRVQVVQGRGERRREGMSTVREAPAPVEPGSPYLLG